MLDNGKYIVFNEQSILIFDSAQLHADVAGNRKDQVTSAGFIQVGVGTQTYPGYPNSPPPVVNGEVTTGYPIVVVSCYGKSTSLGVESNPEADQRLAKFALGL